jgi:two-component system, response regulator, stage 0 sporulation protein F
MNSETKILYIDDEPINIMLFEINFKRRYNVISAASGSEGLEKLRKNPDIMAVVSDMKMPNMNGIEFISKAKNEFPSISYFILSGYDVNDIILNALKTKLITKYFSKPFNAKEIESSIEEAIK